MKTINEQGEQIDRKPGIPAIETRQLVDFMSSNESEMITYAELSAVIGVNVQGPARIYLASARRIILREKSFVYRPIRDVGLKRLTHSEIAKLDDRFQHVRRTSKKSLEELNTVDVSSLPTSDRAPWVGKVSLAAMTAHTHDPKQMKRLEERAGGTQKRLELADTLALFASEEGRP